MQAARLFAYVETDASHMPAQRLQLRTEVPAALATVLYFFKGVGALQDATGLQVGHKLIKCFCSKINLLIGKRISMGRWGLAAARCQVVALLCTRSEQLGTALLFAQERSDTAQSTYFTAQEQPISGGVRYDNTH